MEIKNLIQWYVNMLYSKKLKSNNWLTQSIWRYLIKKWVTQVNPFFFYAKNYKIAKKIGRKYQLFLIATAMDGKTSGKASWQLKQPKRSTLFVQLVAT